MALSVLSAKLDIACPNGTGCHDLLNVKGKYYFYYGPVPTLVFLALVPFWGRATPDSLIAAITGALNVLLFIGVYFQIRQENHILGPPPQTLRAKLRSRAARENWFYPLLWAFGTVHFYMSMHGDIWYLSQVMAQSFLLAAFWLAFSGYRKKWFLSGFFFAMACYTRYDLIFGIFPFLTLIHLSTETRPAFFRRCFVFLTTFLILSLFMLAYNYARFENSLELGLSHMKLEQVSGFAQRAAEVGIFSLRNLVENFYQEILKPPDFLRTFPFIYLNSHGFGILWATPVYLLMLPALIRVYSRYRSEEISDRRSLFALSCLVSLIATATFLFLLSGHGFMQYSARYTLDFQLVLILFLALNPGLFNPHLMWILLGISVYMQTTGAFLFAEFFLKGIS